MEGEQEWVESPDGWGEQEEEEQAGTFDLFGNNDPRDYFTFRVKDDKTLKLAGYTLDSDETAQSTGVTLWQAAPRLAKFLMAQDDMIKGKTVMELGAGLGLVGIVAHHVGAERVIMTDGDTKTLQQMRENVLSNCRKESDSIECRQLLWGAPHMDVFEKSHGKFDVILGADVIYTKASTDPLFDTVACLLDSTGRFILSRYNKWNNVSDEVVLEAASARNLECTQPSAGIFVFHWKDRIEGDCNK